MDFSAQFQDLQARTAAAATTVEQAASESRAQLRQQIDQARADLDQAKNDANQKRGEAADRAQSNWTQLKSDVSAKMDELKTRADKARRPTRRQAPEPMPTGPRWTRPTPSTTPPGPWTTPGWPCSTPWTPAPTPTSSRSPSTRNGAPAAVDGKLPDSRHGIDFFQTAAPSSWPGRGRPEHNHQVAERRHATEHTWVVAVLAVAHPVTGFRCR